MFARASVVVPAPYLSRPEVPARTTSRFWVVVVVAVRRPPPWVVMVPPPSTSCLKVKPREASWVSRTLAVPVTASGVSTMTEVASAVALRMVALLQVITPVATLLDLMPNCWVRLSVPPVRLYWLIVVPTVVEVRLSTTIHGVVRVPPLWFKMPTPSRPR